MAETQREDYYRYQQQPITTSTRSQTGKGNPSTSQVIALATLVPLGASLLILAGLTLTVTVIGLAIATPLFVFFSPVLVPAALIIGISVAGVLTSGAFGITSLSSFAWLASYLRRTRFLEQVKVKQHANPPLEHNVVDHEVQITEEVPDPVERKGQETVQEAQIDQREAGKAQKKNRASS